MRAARPASNACRAGFTGPRRRFPRAGAPRSSGRRSGSRMKPELLEVRDLKTHFALRGGFLDRLRGREAGEVKAVDGVSFTLRRGEGLGIAGESGSGNTTLGRTLLGLVRPSAGSIRLEDEEITGLGDAAFRPL